MNAGGGGAEGYIFPPPPPHIFDWGGGAGAPPPQPPVPTPMLYLAILLHDVCFILHISLYKWRCQLKEYWQNRKDRVSEYICVRVSGARERALECLI